MDSITFEFAEEKTEALVTGRKKREIITLDLEILEMEMLGTTLSSSYLDMVASGYTETIVDHMMLSKEA